MRTSGRIMGLTNWHDFILDLVQKGHLPRILLNVNICAFSRGLNILEKTAYFLRENFRENQANTAIPPGSSTPGRVF